MKSPASFLAVAWRAVLSLHELAGIRISGGRPGHSVTISNPKTGSVWVGAALKAPEWMASKIALWLMAQSRRPRSRPPWRCSQMKWYIAWSGESFDTGGKTPKASQVKKIVSVGCPATHGILAFLINSIG